MWYRIREISNTLSTLFSNFWDWQKSFPTLFKNKLFAFFNWLFSILFIFLGAILTTTFIKAGAIFIVVGILISPYTNLALNKLFKFSLPADVKAIIALASLLIVGILSPPESNEQLVFWMASIFLDYEGQNKLAHFIKDKQIKEAEAIKKKEFLALRDRHIVGLQLLYKDDQYEEVVHYGTPYMMFDPEVHALVNDARESLKQTHIESALKQVPQLLKAGKLKEAYEMAQAYETPKLRKWADTARKRLDEIVSNLQSLYKSGQYEKVIAQGILHTEADCRIERLVNKAKQTQQKKVELERMEAALKKANQLMSARKYEQAYRFASRFEHEALKELAERAEIKLSKKMEKEILAQLKKTASDQVETNVELYAKLVELFPENLRYARKLAYYKSKLTYQRKKPTDVISQEEYGEKWPFTILSGKLECIPPGIVTLQANKKTYAVNVLASSRNYRPIKEVLKDEQVDIDFIIEKGLSLCH